MPWASPDNSRPANLRILAAGAAEYLAACEQDGGGPPQILLLKIKKEELLAGVAEPAIDQELLLIPRRLDQAPSK